MNWFDQVGVAGLLLLAGGTMVAAMTWARSFRRDREQRGEQPQSVTGLRVTRREKSPSEIELTLLPANLERAWQEFRARGGQVNESELVIPPGAAASALAIGHILDWTGRRQEARSVLQQLVGQADYAVSRPFIDAARLHLRETGGTAHVPADDRPERHEPCLRVLRQSPM